MNIKYEKVENPITEYKIKNLNAKQILDADNIKQIVSIIIPAETMIVPKHLRIVLSKIALLQNIFALYDYDNYTNYLYEDYFLMSSESVSIPSNVKHLNYVFNCGVKQLSHDLQTVNKESNSLNLPPELKTIRISTNIGKEGINFVLNKLSNLPTLVSEIVISYTVWVISTNDGNIPSSDDTLSFQEQIICGLKLPFECELIFKEIYLNEC